MKGSLSERQKSLLVELVREYIAHARPVSSQALAPRFGLSSATVRNEMAELEEMGYVFQSHPAGGRIPTDAAYRLFVDALLRRLALDLRRAEAVREAYRTVKTEIEELIFGTLDVLMRLSGQMAWITVPALTRFVIRNVDIVEVSDRSFLILLITKSGVVKSRMVSVEVPVSDLHLAAMKERLNGYLADRCLVDVDLRVVERVLTEDSESYFRLASELVAFLSGAARESGRVHYSAPSALMRQPEFKLATELEPVLRVLQEGDDFSGEVLAHDDAPLSVVIGRENELPELKNCSLIFSPYKVGGVRAGSLGILGPTRLSYQDVLPLIRFVSEYLSVLLGKAGLAI